MARLKVAILAPPWLQIPPKGYGGIEMVLVGLIQELAKKDVDVEVFTVGAMPGFKTVKVHSLYKTEQYEHIHKPMYESLPILAAHMLFSLDEIARQGDFDIIHDHNGFFGPALLRWVSEVPGMPPAIHTNHGPPFTRQSSILATTCCDKTIVCCRYFRESDAAHAGRFKGPCLTGSV
jgi:glycosyltransferase involved in cell wall biosynthesis